MSSVVLMTSSKRHCLLMTFANFSAKVYCHIVMDYSEHAFMFPNLSLNAPFLL